MTTPQEFFKAKPVPKWMSSHPVFKDIKKIHKIFPGIGLPNTKEDYVVDNTATVVSSASQLLGRLNAAFIKRKASLAKFADTHPKMGNARKIQLTQLCETFEQLADLTTKSKNDFIIKNAKNRTTINIPADIKVSGIDKPYLKKGEGLFRAYGKLNTTLREHKFAGLPELERMHEFKQFSADNIPGTPFKIVFSSTGPDGLWDIITMSMRGVVSCQSWGGQYHKCLIGSVLDPFVGIIYLTSDEKFNDYGSKMIKRCIVRFAIDETTRKKYIVLDNMYPGYDDQVANAFVSFLKSKVKDQCEVVFAYNGYGYGSKLDGLYMPITEVRKKIGNKENSDKMGGGQYGGIVSYQDYYIQSKASVKKDRNNALFDKNAAKKAKKFAKAFKTSFVSALKELSPDKVSDNLKPIITKLTTNQKDGWNYDTTLNKIADKVSDEIIDSVNKQDFQNSDTYLRRVYYAYLMRRDEILEEVKGKLVRHINGQLSLKKKLNGKQLLSLIQMVLPQIDTIMKERLKKLADKRKEKFSGPAPLPN